MMELLFFIRNIVNYQNFIGTRECTIYERNSELEIHLFD